MNIWLIIFLPVIIVWGIAFIIQTKCGQSNRNIQEPLIFHSQHISPFSFRQHS
ncbi:DNA recombination protein RecO [Bacillus manliponensis]